MLNSRLVSLNPCGKCDAFMFTVARPPEMKNTVSMT